MVIRSSKAASILPSTRQTCSTPRECAVAAATSKLAWRGHWQLPPMRCISVLNTVSYLHWPPLALCHKRKVRLRFQP